MKEVPNLFLLDTPNVASSVLQQFGFAVSGLLLSYSGGFSNISPLGLAFVAATPEKFLISASVGAALGYIFSQSSIHALRYIAAVLCIFVLSKLLHSTENIKKPDLLSSAISAFCSLATGVALLIADKLIFSTILSYFVEAALAFGSTYFIYKGIELYKKTKTLKSLSHADLTIFTICFCIVLWSLSAFTIFNISPSRIVAVYAILCASIVFKEAGGAIVGTVASIAFSLFSKENSSYLGFAFGGLLSGIFSSQGQLLTAFVFVAVNGVAFVVNDLSFNSAYLLIETAIASTLFVATPKSWLTSLSNYLLPVSETLKPTGLKNALSSRMKIASSTILEVGKNVSAVSDGLKKLNFPNIAGIYANVSEQVCSDCGMYEKCWESNMPKTLLYFDDITNRLKQNEMISTRNMPRTFQNQCIRLTSLAESFNKNYLEHIAKESAQGKVNEMRLVVADQFSSVCDILEDLGNELSDYVCFDTEKQDKIRLALYSFNIVPLEIICKVEKNNRIIIEIEAEKIVNNVSRTSLRDKLETVCGRTLELPTVTENNGKDLIVFCEKCTLQIQTAAHQITCKGESLCGDSFEYFLDGRGKYSVVLSDGMGTGSRAAIDGAMATGLASKLIRAGFSPSCSLRLINSALLIKSREESLSSLDIMQVDLFDGQAEFFKAGAAASFIKKKNKVFEVKKPALPLGILRNIEFATIEGTVTSGDIVVMLSDGATECGADCIKSEILNLQDETPDEIAKSIALLTKEKKGDKHDDLTVIVCKFT